jgi:hypothetical protein
MKQKAKQLIKDFMLQAGTDTSGKWMGVEHAEKFAELIVKECIEVSRRTILSGSGVDPDTFTGTVKTAEKIKEHFGVEE